MKVDKLLKYGIPESVVESWIKSQGEKLLPLQSSAVIRHGLLENRNLIISAPTSSGKTFCGEMAAAANLFRKKKVIFLVPLKAIAEEKYINFLEKYAHLGIKVVISTRDRQEDDRRIEKGNFDLAIMIYEKFNQLLIKNLDILSQVNLIVVDELQMIGDPSRGPTLELALTKVKSSKYSPQILGLSAVLKDVGQLASWLDCKLLLEISRPVELLQGVLFGGKFYFRKHNSGEEGTYPLVEFDSDESHQILFANLEKLVEDGEQVLVFLKSKKTCQDCAILFSEKIHLPSSSSAIEALAELENTTLKEKLIYCLQKGVAFHNADLTFDQRKVVENFYLKGEIRVIFSTTTLSLGINLPARTVFIETQKYQTGEYSNSVVTSPITWSEYENMSGRAGRFGLQKEFGRSIIIAQNKFQFDSLWEEYIEGDQEKICSQLSQKELADVILDLVASGLGKNFLQLERALRSSLEGKPITQIGNLWEKKLQELVQQKLLLEKEKTFSPSPLGSLFAFKGISVDTGLSMKKKLETPADFDPFGWFYSVLDTKDGEDAHIYVGFLEKQSRIYENALAERYKTTFPADEKIRNLLKKKMSFSLKETRLVKLSFLLCEWITSRSTLDLETRYLCRSGQIEQIAKRTSWLLDAAFGMSKVLNSDRRLSYFLKRLSLKVNFGVDDLGIKFARLRLTGLGRDYIWRLTKEGFCTFKKIKQAKTEELKRVIPQPVAERLKEEIEKKPKRSRRPKSFFRFQISEQEKISLSIEGTPVKDKFLVLINGRRTLLPAKSFKYLMKLTWAAFRKEDGWIHKNDFEPGENQTRYLHRLKKQVKPNLSPGQSLLENNRLGCYRLNISKDKIRINAPVLLKNPDIEIKKMVEELTGWISVCEKQKTLSQR